MESHLPIDGDVSVPEVGSRTSDYDYELPDERIAQHPVEPRDASRLLVVDRAAGTLAHRTFRDLAELIPPGDALVVNTTRVFRARLLGKRESGGVPAPATWVRPLRSDGASGWQAASGSHGVHRAGISRRDRGDDAAPHTHRAPARRRERRRR